MKQGKTFIVAPKSKFKLNSQPNAYHGDIEKDAGVAELEEIKQRLAPLQEKLYASGSHAILIIFQAMDAGGKDSIISHVMSGLNPQGCEVHSFKTPNAEEYKHDFLWRHTQRLPARGVIGIHNRSHYENVLICKVHPQFVVKENIPGYISEQTIDDNFWDKRYESIRNFEKNLSENGTVILKFFLNVSKEEQKERLLKRIDDPEKNWKFLSQDLEERKLWKNYMDAYEQAITATSTKYAPWYVIPADKKWYARLTVSKIIEEKLLELDLKFPEAVEKASVLAEAKKQLLKED